MLFERSSVNLSAFYFLKHSLKLSFERTQEGNVDESWDTCFYALELLEV